MVCFSFLLPSFKKRILLPFVCRLNKNRNDARTIPSAKYGDTQYNISENEALDSVLIKQMLSYQRRMAGRGGEERWSVYKYTREQEMNEKLNCECHNMHEDE